MTEDAVSVVNAEVVLPGFVLDVRADYMAVLVWFVRVAWRMAFFCAI